MDVRKNFFTEGEIKHWNGLVEVEMFKLFLKMFKQCVNLAFWDVI